MAVWRTNICDSVGNVISHVSTIAAEEVASYDLDGMTSYMFRVPSSDERIQTLADDGYPLLNLTGSRRIVKLYQEVVQGDGTSLWAIRFAGWIVKIDEDLGEQAGFARVLCLGAGHRLAKLLARDAAGSAELVQFASTDVGVMFATLLTRAQAQGETGIIMGDAVGAQRATVTWSYKDLAETVMGLSQRTSGFDFELQSLDRLDGKIARLNLYYPSKGSGQDAVFTWGGPARNCTMRYLEDASDLANTVIGIGRTGIASTATDSTSIAQHGLCEDAISFHEIQTVADLQAATSDELAKRKNPTRVYVINGDPGNSPEPWKDFDLGDTINLRAGTEQREGGWMRAPRIQSYKVWPGDSATPDRFRVVAS